MNANGRVNILDPINSNVFQLYDKIPVDEKKVSDNKLDSRLPVNAFL